MPWSRYLVQKKILVWEVALFNQRKKLMLIFFYLCPWNIMAIYVRIIHPRQRYSCILFREVWNWCFLFWKKFQGSFEWWPTCAHFLIVQSWRILSKLKPASMLMHSGLYLFMKSTVIYLEKHLANRTGLLSICILELFYMPTIAETDLDCF